MIIFLAWLIVFGSLPPVINLKPAKISTATETTPIIIESIFITVPAIDLIVSPPLPLPQPLVLGLT